MTRMKKRITLIGIVLVAVFSTYFVLPVEAGPKVLLVVTNQATIGDSDRETGSWLSTRRARGRRGPVHARTPGKPQWSSRLRMPGDGTVTAEGPRRGGRPGSTARCRSSATGASGPRGHVGAERSGHKSSTSRAHACTGVWKLEEHCRTA